MKHKHKRKFKLRYSKLKKIYELHNKPEYRGQEIWLLGTGPSLDDFPDDFFDDKLSIAVKVAMVGFPNCTFNLTAYQSWFTKAYYRTANNYDLLKKSIIVLRKGTKPKWPPGYENDPWYMVYGKRMENRISAYNKAAKLAIDGAEYNYPSSNTIFHKAMWAAIILGAKKIYLCGAEHRGLINKYHAHKNGMKETYTSINNQKTEEVYRILATGQEKGQLEMKFGTNAITEAVKPYGIEIVRYLYNSGEEKIV